MPDEVVAGEVAVGVVAVVGVAGQVDGPVGGDQAEAVPASAPGLRNPSALEDDVVDARVGQLMADGQAGLPGPDHHDLVIVPHQSVS